MSLDVDAKEKHGCGCDGFYSLFGVHRPGCQSLRGTFHHKPNRNVLISGEEEVAKMKRLEAVAEAAEAYVDAGHGDEADPLLWDIVTALDRWREGKEGK